MLQQPSLIAHQTLEQHLKMFRGLALDPQIAAVEEAVQAAQLAPVTSLPLGGDRDNLATPHLPIRASTSLSHRLSTGSAHATFIMTHHKQ